MSDLLSKFLAANRIQHKGNWIYCIGDSMVDEYWESKVNRISPEFPMPIVHVREKKPTRRPGGAANVVHQMRHFNAKAQLISIIDASADRVYYEHELNTDLCVVEDCFLPRKQRYLDNGIQVIRIDQEDTDFYMSKEGIESATLKLVDKIRKERHTPGVVVFSDYNKGLLYDPQMFMKYFKDSITLVDPKKGPIEKWKGCTVFKPNAIEAKELSGLDKWQDQCKYFKKHIGCKAVVITQGGTGFVGLEEDFFEYRPRSRVNVESVVGAGDCFMATFAMALDHQFTVQESAEIAFRAGSIYVQNKMNRPIVPGELSVTKLVEPYDLKSRDFKLTYSNGCFDVIHPGHIHIIREAARFGDKLVIALNSDESISKLKGPTRPVNSLEDRIAVISAIKEVDFVTVFGEDTPYESIKGCMPDVLVKGGDYVADKLIGADLVPEVQIIPLVTGKSTTNMVKKING